MQEENSIKRIVSKQKFTNEDLFFHNDLWHCFEVHSRFSNPNKTVLLEILNQLIESTFNQISNAFRPSSTTEALLYACPRAMKFQQRIKYIFVYEILTGCRRMPTNVWAKRSSKEARASGERRSLNSNLISIPYCTQNSTLLPSPTSPPVSVQPQYMLPKEGFVLSAMILVLTRSIVHNTSSGFKNFVSNASNKNKKQSRTPSLGRLWCKAFHCCCRFSIRITGFETVGMMNLFFT